MHRQAMAAADHEDLPQLAAREKLLHLHVLGIDAHLPRQGERHAGALHGGDDALALGHGERHRLLEDDLLAGRGRLLDERGVQRRLCGHYHRLDPRVAEKPRDLPTRLEPVVLLRLGEAPRVGSQAATARTSISGWSRHCARYVFTCPCARPSTPTVTAISGKLLLERRPPGPIASAMGGWPRRSSVTPLNASVRPANTRNLLA